MIGAVLLFLLQNGASGGGDDLDAALGFLLFFFVVTSPYWILRGLGNMARAKEEKKYKKARVEAHDFTPPNVHGRAGYAAKKTVKARGWLNK